MSKTQHDSETLKEGQQVITACGFIWQNFDGVHKVFLAKRADTKNFLPGVYELPGGHIEFGEDPRAGLAREVMEELGMRVAVGEVVDVFAYINDIKKSHSIEVIFFAQFTDPLEKLVLHPDDHSTCGWFAVDELEQSYVDEKDVDDPEVKILHKAFAMLEK